MSTWVVTRKSDGEEVYRYGADAPVEWQGFEFATHDHTALAEPEASTIEPETRTWNQVEFLRRFTAEERVVIRTLVKTNPYVEDYMLLLNATPVVHSNDKDVVGGLNMLEQGGVIASGRAAEILNGN
jgi:hypothetical protein